MLTAQASFLLYDVESLEKSKYKTFIIFLNIYATFFRELFKIIMHIPKLLLSLGNNTRKRNN